MTEPTLEEMKQAVLDRYPNAHSHQEQESGSWGIFVRPSQTYGETLWFATEELAWSNAYSKSPTKASLAPDSEDEAFERWWVSEGYTSSARTDYELSRIAWNARARLSAGGK
jgi:hypothetical protein